MEDRKRSEYRSSIRSRMMITGALVSLMSRMPFEAITVTDIVKEADINRGTFYSHYKSTYDVVRKAETELAREVLAIFSESEGKEMTSLLEKVSSLIEERRTIYENLFKSDEGASFKAVLEKGICEYLQRYELPYEDSLFISAGISALICESVRGRYDIKAAAGIAGRLF